MNPTTKTNNPSESSESVSGRRSLLGKTAVVAAGLLASQVFSPMSAFSATTKTLTFADIPGTGDVKVVNYALALEDLEADLYAQAFMRLTNGGANQLGIHIPGLGINPNQPDVFYTREFGKVELQHSTFLRNTLGGAAIPKFKYNFNMQNLTRKQVADQLFAAEMLGVGAYLGAVPSFATATYLQVAGAILGTEARHTAALAEIIDKLFGEKLSVAPLTAQFGSSSGGRDIPVTPNNVLATVSPFIVM